jgi:hypothetical protein
MDAMMLFLIDVGRMNPCFALENWFVREHATLAVADFLSDADLIESILLVVSDADLIKSILLFVFW